MSETEAVDSSSGQTGGVKAFGQALLDARKKNNLTVEEVAKAINLSVDTVDAIEKSDNARLPGPAFVQGYLRNYAKYIGVPEKQVLDIYNKAVPHAREAQIKPRAPVNREISLRTPLVLGVSIILVVSGLATLGYGIYSYYTEKAETIEVAQNEATELQERVEESYILPVEKKMTSEQEEPQLLPEDGAATDQQADVASESIEQSELFATVEEVLQETEITQQGATESEQAVGINEQLQSFETPEVIGRAQVETQPLAPGNDEIQLVSSGDSWVEISDKNGVILYYDLMPPDKPVRLKGTAPFDVFLGNAPVVQLVVNGVEVDMSEHIRSNNIAHYRVSVKGGQVVFAD